MLKDKKGFTLIELLVVIAIIGILSAVVLASLSTARNKAKAASAVGSVSAMRAQAELGNNSGAYIVSMCTINTSVTPGGLLELLTAANNQAGTGKATCVEATDKFSWESVVDLTGIGGSGANSYFCVDSSGYASYRATTASSTAVGSTVSCN
jgi:prepilin-type N-terminal cleavage/methylation domain-containing protein